MSALHLSPKILDGSELQLLHCSLAAAKFAGDLPDTLLLDKTHVNHSKLRLRKPVHQLEQHGAAFDLLGTRPRRILRRITRLAAAALPMIRHSARSDPQQPGDKRNPAPFELLDPRQGLAEDF